MRREERRPALSQALHEPGREHDQQVGAPWAEVLEPVRRMAGRVEDRPLAPASGRHGVATPLGED
jgi:hypothetical protein